jgi:hypothetical protein
MFPAMIGWHLVHGSMALSIVGISRSFCLLWTL